MWKACVTFIAARCFMRKSRRAKCTMYHHSADIIRMTFAGQVIELIKHEKWQLFSEYGVIPTLN